MIFIFLKIDSFFIQYSLIFFNENYTGVWNVEVTTLQGLKCDNGTASEVNTGTPVSECTKNGLGGIHHIYGAKRKDWDYCSC